MYCVTGEKLEKIIYAEKGIGGNKRIERLSDIVMTQVLLYAHQENKQNKYLPKYRRGNMFNNLFYKIQTYSKTTTVIRLQFYLILTHRYWAVLLLVINF